MVEKSFGKKLGFLYEKLVISDFGKQVVISDFE